MNLNHTKSNSISVSKKIDVNHYIRLIFEKKYWIIGIVLILTILWILIYPKILSKDKEYDFTAIVRFEDPRSAQNASGVDERFTWMETESKIRIISTTEFLNTIVDSLRLNIQSQSRKISREEMFEKINLDRINLKYGRYEVQSSGNEAYLYYTNKEEGKEDYKIASFPIKHDSLLNIKANGIEVLVNPSVFKENKNLNFSCIPSRYVIERLRAKLRLNLNRQQTLFGITFSNTDPLLGTKITNVIADEFLKQSLEFKRARTASAMTALEEQLRASKEQLEQVEQDLKEFREQNPHIYLTQGTAEYNQTIGTYAIEQDQIQMKISQLNQLIQEKDNASNIDKALIYQEILTFLQEQNVAGIAALNQQYAGILSQRDELIQQGFSEENLRLIEINQNMQSMQQTIDERIRNYQDVQNDRIKQLGNSIKQTERYLRQSPNKEMQLAKLQRDQQAKSQVYSSVLIRYNEIKTAHASIAPDAFLLERAQVPVVFSDIIDQLYKLAKLMLGPLLGFIIAITIFVGLDFIWHRARSISDMENILKLPVIATIPLLKTEENIQNVVEVGKRMDPLLVTIDYTPSMGADAFRNFRTRLILTKDKDAQHQVVITSLMPNEGKSLVASNLAITFAQLKKQTVLIDTDIRRGVIHNSFLCKKKPGISDLLARGKDLNRDSIGQVVQKTTIPNLYLITSGSSVPNPTELLIGDKIEKVLQIIQKQFHYIIIDTPPIEFIPDAFVLNQYIQNMFLVTRYGETNLKQLKKKLNEYDDKMRNIKGIVLNASTDVLEKKYQSYSYYKY